MKLFAPFVLLGIVLAVAIYFDKTPPPADLTIVNRADVFTLDPQRQSYIQDFRMSYALFEGLLRWDNHDFSIHPAAATAMPAVSDDQLTYDFIIRDDARWSNGDPVTAHDFAYSWMRLLLPDTAADYSNMFFVIDGAEAFWQWRAETTSRFAADPYQNVDQADADSVIRMIARLRALLDADSLPADLPIPMDPDAQRLLRSELATLERAVASGSSLRSDLLSATTTQQAMTDLSTSESRGVESRWMWEQTQERFTADVGIVALSDQHLRIQLGQPCAFFLDLLCFGVCYPVHRPTVEGWPAATAGEPRNWASGEQPLPAECRWVNLDPATGRLEQRHEWARPGRIVSNGPYVLTQWRYKRDMRLERSPTYHTPELVRSPSVTVLTIEDTNTRVMSFEAGGTDWLTEVSADYDADMIEQLNQYIANHRGAYDAFRADGLSHEEALAGLPEPEDGERRNVHVFETFGIDFYSFNCREKLSSGQPNPFADARVRRAFTRAIDKQVIVRDVVRRNERAVNTLIPPDSIRGYGGPDGLTHDAEHARRELADAGWTPAPDGSGLIDAEGRPFPPVEILWSTNTPEYKWISLNLKAQWEAALGVTITLRDLDTKFFKEDLKQGKFMIARGRWYGDYGDPTTFLNLNLRDDGNNDRAFFNQQFEDLLEQAEMELDPDRRMAILAEAERIIVEEELPLMPLRQLSQVYMYEPGTLTGLSRHNRLTQYIWQLKVNTP